MVTPFRRHQQRVRGLISGTIAVKAAPAALAPPTPETPLGQEYASLRALLHDNLRTLADVQSIEARNPMKAEFAKAFAPWISGVVEAGKNSPAAQDEILIQVMIWAIDYRDFDYALDLGEHALHHHLILPERFNRTVACFLAEEIATISLDHADTVDHAQLMRVEAMTSGFDMPDPAKAKLHKAIARSYRRRADAFDPAADNAPAGGKASYVAAALESAKRAFELDRNIGVKKDIEQLERQLKEFSRDDAG